MHAFPVEVSYKLLIAASEQMYISICIGLAIG
jgi:hypothetical protein